MLKLQQIKEHLINPGRYNFIFFLIGSIGLASTLVVVSMFLYDRSGAAQLDLSRPGYVDVRSQSITSDSDFVEYPSTGSVNQSTIDEFKTLFDQQSEKAKAIDAFGGDPLSDSALGIEIAPTVDESTN